jgi:hypothetical protein
VALFVRSAGVSEEQMQAMRRMPMWKGLERLALTLVYDSGVLGAGHARPTTLLSRVTVPTLVMHGGAGSPAMRDAARPSARRSPRRGSRRSRARRTAWIRRCSRRSCRRSSPEPRKRARPGGPPNSHAVADGIVSGLPPRVDITVGSRRGQQGDDLIRLGVPTGGRGSAGAGPEMKEKKLSDPARP